jgi:phosphoribosylpyrophosphate synthetase
MLSYSYSKTLWHSTNESMKIDRNNCQLIFLDSHEDDLTSNFPFFLKDNGDVKFTGHTTGTIEEETFPDKDKDLSIVNASPKVEHVYLIGSIEDEADFSRVHRVADHFKHTLNASWVTLVATYLSTTRQDKNVNNKGEFVSKTINIRAELGGLAPFIDRFIVYEPHSYSTQTFAACWDRPLAPLSPWKYVMDVLVRRGVSVPKRKTRIFPDSNNSVIVGPDKGRNLAARRISQYLDIPYVSFDKKRLSKYGVSVLELSKKEQRLLKGRVALAFDDEFSTFGTANAVSRALERYGARAFAMAGVHGKFTGDWRKNIKHPLLTTILTTDSREPVSRIPHGGYWNGPEITRISLAPFTKQILEADVNGINFWSDKRFSHMILQEKSR